MYSQGKAITAMPILASHSVLPKNHKVLECYL
jgi:hypothetical protein